MRECEESSRVCTQEEPCDWISRLAHDWRVTKGSTRVKHAGKLKGHASCSTIEKTSSLARKLAHNSNS